MESLVRLTLRRPPCSSSAMRVPWWLVVCCASGPAAAPQVVTPSDDPNDWQVDPSRSWTPKLGTPRQLVPDRAALPPEARPIFPSNNNGDLKLHDGRLYFAWRTSETHFASANTRLHVLSSGDLGASWQYETTRFIGADMREPHFLSFQGRLHFDYFEAGVDRFSFEPKHQWRLERLADGGWTEAEVWGQPEEITWDEKVRDGVAWRTSYKGNHYAFGMTPDLRVFFTRSTDGVTWEPVSGTGDGVVYTGGVSEAAFEFDAQGDLWSVLRNEDGDTTGFGSHVCVAKKESLGSWSCTPKSDPERYDSPKMFRHGDELFLVARRDVGGPFDLGRTDLSFADQQLQYNAAYSGRAKRTALYRIDRAAMKVVWVFDFPSAGDTAFPGIVRLDAHRFLISNYTSPLDGDLDRSWWNGQNAPEGTHVYAVELTFE
jgi:hypothetical protein